MQPEHFIVREPLLNSQERVLGYELHWQHAVAPGRRPTDGEILSLAQFVADQLNDAESGALLGDQILFVEATPALLAHESFSALPPKGTVVALRGADVAGQGAISAIRAMRAKGYGISMRAAHLTSVAKNPLPPPSPF